MTAASRQVPRRSAELAALAPSAWAPSGTAASHTITLYSGQHEQTTAALVAAFEKQTGIKVAVRIGDEAVARQPDHAGGLELARRRLLHREHAAARSAARAAGLLAPVAPRRSPRSRAATTRAQGDWVGVSARVSALVYNTAKLEASQLPARSSNSPTPQWKGKLGFAPSRDRLPADRHRDRQARTAPPRPNSWLKGLQEASGTSTPTTRRSSRRSTTARAPLGVDQPLLLVPAARRGRSGARPLRAALLRARRPRLPRRRLRRRRSCARAPTRPRRRSSSRSSSARPARRSSPTARATSTRCGPGSRPPSRSRPFATAAARDR